MSSVLKKADKLNLSLSLHQYSTIYCVPYCVCTDIGMQYWNDVKKGTSGYHYD